MKLFWRIIKRDGLFILIIFSVIILFFNKIVFQDQIYIPGDFLRSDTINLNLPLKYTLYQNLQAHKIPFWTDKIFNGFPLFAEGQIGFFYPFNVLPALLFSFVKTYNLSIVLNFFWAALGMFFLARSFRLNSVSSLISSITFSLSSFFVCHITHHGILATSAWLPFLFLSFKKYVQTEKYQYLILTSIIIGIETLTGYFQLIFYSVFIIFIFFLFYKKSIKMSFGKLIFSYSLSLFLGLLLGAIQILPTLELVNQSTRQKGLSHIALDSLPYNPRNLISFIFPYIFGDPGLGTYPRFGGSWGMFWENTGYVGLITLVLAAFSLKIVKKNKTILWLWMLFFISIFLALGKYGPLFWIYYLPGFNMFRVTGRFLLFVVFFISLIAGFGLDYIGKELKNIRLKISFYIIIFFSLVIDLFLFGYSYNPVTRASLILEKPPIVKYLEKKMDDGKIFSVAAFLTYDEINKNGWRNNLSAILNHKNALDPNINMIWNIGNFEGYPGLFLQRNETFRNLIYQGISLKKDKIKISPTSLKLLGLANTKFLVSAFELEGVGMTKINEFGQGEITYKLYKNDLYRPLGILIDSYRSVNNYEVFNDLAQEKFKPEKELLLEVWLINNPKNGNNSFLKEKVEMEQQTESNFNFNIISNTTKWLLFQESYYPGWQAYINGRETVIYPADGMFMAVLVPKGFSKVEFIYRPVSLYIGAVISITTLLVMSTFLILKKNLAKFFDGNLDPTLFVISN